MKRVALVLFLVGAVTSCFVPAANFNGSCDDSHPCSTGYHCVQGQCREACATCGCLAGSLADAGPYGNAVLADCPVAFWPLDDPPASASAADATGNGHPGTPTSGVTFGVPGLVTGGGRTAAQFDGAAGFVNVAEAPDLQFKTSLTIEVWIKASTLSGITGTRFLHKGTGDATGYALRATTGTNNHLQLELETWGSAFGSTLLSGDTRYYLAATYDGANVNVYVNGNLDGSSPANQSIQSSAGPLNIGRRGDGMGYFNGVMSGVAVYPRALTAAQILAHYNAGK